MTLTLIIWLLQGGHYLEKWYWKKKSQGKKCKSLEFYETSDGQGKVREFYGNWILRKIYNQLLELSPWFFTHGLIVNILKPYWLMYNNFVISGHFCFLCSQRAIQYHYWIPVFLGHWNSGYRWLVQVH